MKSLTDVELFMHYCKNNKQWGLMLSIPEYEYLEGNLDVLEEIEKAAPYLKVKPHDLHHNGIADDIKMNNGGFLFFESEKEMLDIYYQTVGEDGPTKLNPYVGPVKIYALTCSPEGQLLSENT